MITVNYISKKIDGIIHIWDPVHQDNYWVFIVKDHKEFKTKLKKQIPFFPDHQFSEIAEAGKTSGGFTVVYKQDNDNANWKQAGDIYVIWSTKNLCNLTHEIFHAVQYVLEDKGMNIPGNDEPGAYLMGFLVKQILKHFDLNKWDV